VCWVGGGGVLSVGVGHAGVHLCHQSACPLREHECPLSTPPSGNDHNSYRFFLMLIFSRGPQYQKTRRMRHF
jgi:hypothetical protein